MVVFLPLRVELKQSNHQVLGRAKEALQKSLADSYLGKLFTNNFVWSTIGLAITLAVVIAVLVAIGASHRNDLLATMVMVMIFGLPCAMAGGAMAFSGWNRSLGGQWLLIGGLILLVADLWGCAVRGVGGGAGLANARDGGALLAAGALSGAGFLL